MNESNAPSGSALLSKSDIQQLLQEQRGYFASGSTRSLAFRLEQLRKLRDMLDGYEEDIHTVVDLDLHKPRFEMLVAEIISMRDEANYALENLEAWTKPQEVHLPGRHLEARGLIYPEPYGISLIISPWNYPFLLLFSPLVGSIAAGNCTFLKPSEISQHSSHLIAEMIANTFDPRYIAVVEGGMEVNEPLLAEKFDYILFTGSTAVGRAVMRAAADHLTPVTLELGGKSPCIVASDANLENAANRITWGKFLNAGQTCIAPDYLLVQEEVKEQLLEAIKRYIRLFYGDDPSRSPNYSRIINERHFERLARLLEEGNIIIGGELDKSELFMAPTVLDGVSYNSPVMQEEIFGPILPVFTYRDLDEAIAVINSRAKPLALYFFSSDPGQKERILNETSSGGVSINATLLHAAAQTIPYGGVGESGLGAYQGKCSFDTFSHYKGVYAQNVAPDYHPRPPYPDTPF